MSETAQLWADPTLVYPTAGAAVTLLVATVWLFRRRKKSGRPAAVICLVLSIALHGVLLVLVPMVWQPGIGRESREPGSAPAESKSVRVSAFDPDSVHSGRSEMERQGDLAPLPIATLDELLDQHSDASVEVETAEPNRSDAEPGAKAEHATVLDQAADPAESQAVESALSGEDAPSSLSTPDDADLLVEQNQYDAALDALIAESLRQVETKATVGRDSPQPKNPRSTIAASDASRESKPAAAAPAAGETRADDLQRDSSPANAESLKADFANRAGSAKQAAIEATGGDARTESAVAKALRFLAKAQRRDGAWDPRASNAGQERAPLGEQRGGAGGRAETAITGLALLAFIGAGNTHRQGEYADTVFRGLVYLIQIQKPDGSLAGNASIYAATYSHGMASLAMAEAAAMTEDASAVEATRRAAAYTQRIQHPSTGGFRYRVGDPGDLSQLGWQAMVLDGAHRAKVRIDPASVQGIQRFLRSVRAGTRGGLARYRPGERPSRTMTAEALATRLLLGEEVPAEEIAEAESYLLQELPGTAQDNYYYWYYATIALHQLQDDSWRRWNAALKQRLLQTQQADGSWPTSTMWGGYGGRIYTTAMATLCLEAYYRHAVRNRERIARVVESEIQTPTRY